MLKKPVLLAAVAATMATATLSTPADAADPVLSALVGGGVGAAIGHSINGVHGAWAGGALGAIVGASVAADANRHYYDRGYRGGPAYYGRSTTYYAPSPTYYEPAPMYYQPAPVYYESAPVYYTPAPVYYAPPTVVYRSGPRHAAPYRPYVNIRFADRHGWRDRGGDHYRGGHRGDHSR